MKPAPELNEAYGYCRRQTATHYENFPVASWLLPKRLRNPIAAIYCFARTADDIADEGNVTAKARLHNLNEMAQSLDGVAQGQAPKDLLYTAIADTVSNHALPIQLFHDLLTAFRQDVAKTRYANFTEVLEYCRYSANPVGRLLLHLFKTHEPADLEYSDSICSALQLINFLQDLHQDYAESGRIYIPLDELRQFGVTEDDFANRISNPAMGRLMDFQTQRATALLCSGAPLGMRLEGRPGLELRLIIMGGLCILRRLRNQEHNLLSRPRLSAGDWVRMFWYGITKRFPASQYCT